MAKLPEMVRRVAAGADGGRRHLPVLQSLRVEGKSARCALLVTYPKRENRDSGTAAVPTARWRSAARYSVAPKPQLAATPAAPVSRPGKSEYRSPHCRLDKCGRSDGSASCACATAESRNDERDDCQAYDRHAWPPLDHHTRR
jgi:hypothetical protein